MKMTILKPTPSKTVIPEATLELAHLAQEEKLDTYICNQAIALTKSRMTANELIQTITALKDISAELTEKLESACGSCDSCGYCFGDEESEAGQECKNCATPCSGIEIPNCILEEAGISPDAELEIDTMDGEITIRESTIKAKNDYDDHSLKNIPEELLLNLASKDICIPHMKELLESGEIIYGR